MPSHRPVAGLPAAAAAALLTAAGAVAQPAPDDLRAALEVACSSVDPAVKVLHRLGGGIVLESGDLDAPETLTARRDRLLLPDGTRLRLDIHRRGDRLAQVILEVTERVHGALRPRWWVVMDGGCRVRVARRLEYRETGVAQAVHVLDGNLVSERARLPLDEPVPPGAVPSGVPVAMVDSGVNYTLAPIAARLARDRQGTTLGYDYWDLDPRPFDSHPSASPFLPQRHGTRTASVLLQEAPVATLVPMRYPRGDMTRMARLVADAAARGVGIVNLSLGGTDAQEWRAFAVAAREHPRMLFVASAGNEGRDLDREPVYPAALALANLVTVSSADAQGLPARGSNWGRRSVDLLVPAEDLVATDFNGYAARVAGSSYAAARVSALAACLKAAHPQWSAAELKDAIFALARQTVHESMAYVRVGVLPDPTQIRRGACPPEPASVERIGRLTLEPAAVYPRGEPPAGHELVPLTLVWLEDAGWALESLPGVAAEAAQVLAQCGLRFGPVTVELLRAPHGLRHYDTGNALALMAAVSVATPAAWFVRDTLQQPAFDAEAIGRANAGTRTALVNTLWLTAHLEHPGIALAHELYHVLADTGGHARESDNLMHPETRPGATRLMDWQCDRLLKVATAFGLAKPLAP